MHPVAPPLALAPAPAAPLAPAAAIAKAGLIAPAENGHEDALAFRLELLERSCPSGVRKAVSSYLMLFKSSSLALSNPP